MKFSLAINLERMDPSDDMVAAAHHTTETAIEATKLGAYDYLLKPFDPGELLELVHKAVVGSRLVSAEVAVGSGATGQDTIIGESRAMQDVYKEIGRLATKPVSRSIWLAWRSLSSGSSSLSRKIGRAHV